ncbi:MAG: DNA translocase FtsK 4TM domain-containing protein, partial [Propionivibrio sp.]|nr:DNA translocase FtsK 4TM domain-containing protein [Propionivibrio sp.]MBP6711765.1 DNA translocase FtsK 4TM domain-containing protein [Propionivibrio sp.]
MASLQKNTGTRVERKASNPPSPLPEKIALVLQESRWLALIVLAAFLGLALWGYNRADPGWSHAMQGAALHNPAGRGGAWLADLLLYLFGVSAWWWIVLLLAVVWWGYRRLDGLRTADRRPLYIALAGFFLVIISSAALESLRFYSIGAELPLQPGGMLGLEIGRATVHAFGYTGATLTLIAALALGWSIFTGMSWLTAAERMGALVELAYSTVRGLIDRWQDRRIGREVAREREAVVEVEKKRVETKEPIIIEAPEPVEPLPPKVEKRIERERQVPLFPEAVEGGLLPPLHLLEPAAEQSDRVSPESLEYTSRLIERKLADFGVQVQVLAAYPGPVITRYEIEPAVGVKGAQIVNLAKDMARALSMVSIRVVETVPGKSCMALELPNAKRQMVRLSEIISSSAYHSMSSPLAMTLGKDIGGHPVVVDLAKMPHLLVAGTTGSGKSVGINAMILSLLYKSEPDKVR